MEKTKVLMVYPETPTTYWSFKYALSFIGKKALLPPLGLLTVAALLPDDFECRLIDMNTDPLCEDDIRASDIVFVSAMLVQKQSFEDVVGMCNRCGVPVVAGGPYPTSCRDSITGVDHFVLNEAEVTLPLFVADYRKGAAGHVYSDDTKPDICMTPPPRLDLIDLRKYSVVALQYSRGCPFNCEFCDIIELFGRMPRTKTTQQFVSELEAVYRTGFRGPVFIVDDNFIGNTKNVKELLREVISWQRQRGMPFNFLTEASINLSQDDELMDLMVDANFTMTFIGIETPVKESLAQTGKKQNLKEDLIDSIHRIQRKGIEVTGGFIVGFDTDPENVFDIQLRFIRESGIPNAMIGLLMALPNTRLYHRLNAEGRIVRESDGNNTHNVELNFIPAMPPEKLVAGYNRMLSEIYTPENYFNRCLDLLGRLPVRSARGRPVKLAEIKALCMSLFRQGFSYYGREYFRFLFRASRISPKYFSTAVGMAIEGYHFIRITRERLRPGGAEKYLERNLAAVHNELEEIVREAYGYGFMKGTKAKKPFPDADAGSRRRSADMAPSFDATISYRIERLKKNIASIAHQ